MTEQQFPGSRWWKFDFHTHTPQGSSDYRGDKSISAKTWLTHHKDRGVDCVVVTDHNGSEWLDVLQAELVRLRETDNAWESFFILPGVEISCSSGVHVLAILNETAKAKDIAAMVGKCGYQGTLGDSDAVTTTSVVEVMKIVQGAPWNGLAIPAHVDCPKGLFKSIQDSQTLKDILNTANALQTVDVQALATLVKDNDCCKLIAQLAQVQGSDSHNAEQASAEVFTWVKLTRPSLSGLKLALAEPQLSVRRSDQTPDPLPKQWIQSLQIQGLDKRHQPLTIDFNPWLNTLIGGRGSGKSSVVECLRLALGREKEAEGQLSPEHEVSKAIVQFSELMVLGKTELLATVQGAGSLGGINQYKWSKNVKHVMRPDEKEKGGWVDTGIEYRKVPEEFPVRLFSQKQIHALANQPGGLLSYLDASRTNGQNKKIEALKWDFSGTGKSPALDLSSSNPYQLKEALLSELGAQNRDKVHLFGLARLRVQEISQQLSAWPQVKSDLAQVQDSLDAYAKQGVSDKASLLQKLRVEKRAIEDFAQGVSADVMSLQNAFGSMQLNEWVVTLPDNASEAAREVALGWQQAFQAMQATWATVQTQMQSLQTQARQLTTDAAYQQWATELQLQEEHCLNALENVKAMLGGQLKQVGVLQQQKEDLEIQNKMFELKANELQAAKVLRQQRYQEMVAARQAITQARQDFLNAVIQKASEKTLQITVHPMAQYDVGSLNELRKLLGLNVADYANSFLGDVEDQASKGIVPILAKDPTRLEELKNDLEEFVTGEGEQAQKIMGVDVSGARIRAALKALTPRQLDELWTWFPEDKVEIKFRPSPKDTWQDISTGSAGQKTGALLSFILNEGEEPLILDQPEDDLDNENVSKLVVEQLRTTKSQRQIIVVTHNANIVVNGDAELVIPMAFRGKQIQADATGGLQDASIRQKICDVMEGGDKAFSNRYERVLKHKLAKV